MIKKLLIICTILSLTACTPLTSFLTGGLGGNPSGGVSVDTSLGIQKGDNAYDGKLSGGSVKTGSAQGQIAGNNQANYSAGKSLVINNKDSSLWVWIFGSIAGALICFGFWALPRPSFKKIRAWIKSRFIGKKKEVHSSVEKT